MKGILRDVVQGFSHLKKVGGGGGFNHLHHLGGKVVAEVFHTT